MKFLDKTAEIRLTDVFNVSLRLEDGTEYNEVELRHLRPRPLHISHRQGRKADSDDTQL